MRTRDFFVVGGTMSPDAPSYVERPADRELLLRLEAGELCHVLTARQMGKSSLLMRTGARLRQSGIRTAYVELTQIGRPDGPEEWFYGLLHELRSQLKIAAPLKPWWQERETLSPVQRFVEYMRESTSIDDRRTVIFIDEIDSTLGLPFADDFFAAVRSLYNERATATELHRLSFVLVGVASPDQLMANPLRTPFNVGSQVALSLFTAEQTGHLLEDDGRLRDVLEWTGGQPFLTQFLCREAAERPSEPVAELVDKTFLRQGAVRQEQHLSGIADRLCAKPGVRDRLRLYRQILDGRDVLDQPGSAAHSSLKLSGVVTIEPGGCLRPTCPIYQRVFDRKWLADTLPRRPIYATISALLATVLLTLGAWSAWIAPRPWIEQLRIAEDDYSSALLAHGKLKNNPLFPDRYADALLATFWDRRAARSGLARNRDHTLLYTLKALEIEDTELRRQAASHLLGDDWPLLEGTLRHDDPVLSAAFSADGKHLFSGDQNGTLRMWRHDSKHLVSERLSTARDVLRSIAWFTDGRSAFSTQQGKAVLRAPLSSTRGIPPTTGSIPLFSTGRVRALAFSATGQYVITGGLDGLAYVLESSTGQRVGGPLKHGAQIYAAAFSPEGRLVVTAGSDQVARLWKLGGSSLEGTFAHRSFVTAATFSPDGKLLATGSLSGNGSLWDVASGELATAPFHHGGSLSAVTFSPDGRLLATGGRNGNVRLWQVATGRPFQGRLYHDDSIKSIAFSPDGRHLMTASEDRTVRLWTVPKEFTPGDPIPAREMGFVKSLSFAPGVDFAFAGMSYGRSRLWEVSTGRPRVAVQGTFSMLSTSLFSPDGRYLATASKGDGVRLWDPHSGIPLIEPLLQNSYVRSLAFSYDGRYLGTGSHDGTVRLLEASSGRQLAEWDSHTHAIAALAFSPDGRILAAGSFSGPVRFWQLPAGRAMGNIPTIGELRSLVFSADGRFMAMATRDGMASLWDASTQKLLGSLRILDGKPPINPRPRLVLAATPDGNLISSGRTWIGRAAMGSDGLKALDYRFVYSGDVGESLSLSFPPDCNPCDDFVIFQGIVADQIRTRRLSFTGYDESPIKGEPGALLAQWQERLGLELSQNGRIVPATRTGAPP